MKLCKGKRKSERREMQHTSTASMFITYDGTVFVVRDKERRQLPQS